VERADNNSVSKLDLDFHRLVVTAANSDRLYRTFQTVEIETRMCLTQLEFTYSHHPDLTNWHRDMVDAVRNKDPGQARRAAAAHDATVLEDLFAETPKS